ncbi:hypothetical protein BDB00DRAFT_805238 [Zychaea mexicana]|uniref:uncharacterized protein n=1 Tax=Zychaea mexicana TaxID=64656 RepID=UPI0022FF00E9|nr:uncharacterized protein BDB00DRAFT_805238 [Zychaea mexicana]KAI9497163.1 hypothetical protein BDB00DRAFT_805238 [Zychaea mexicana]
MVDRPVSSTEKLVENAYAGTVHQAYQFLQAVEMNRQQPLSNHCIEYLAKYIAHAWEPTTPADPSLLDELISLMHSLPLRVPAYCPGLALLLAIYYVDRLKQLYINIKGAHKCSLRLLLVAYTVAAKYLRNNLQLIMNDRMPTTPPADDSSTATKPALLSVLSNPPKGSAAASDKQQVDQTIMARMELELLHFLNYNLSIDEPSKLIWWAKAYEYGGDNNDLIPHIHYISGDEGDDELEHDDDL